MGDIKIEAHEGQIRFHLGQEDQSATFSIDPSQAEVAAMQVLDLVAQVRGPQTKSLLEQIPMVSQHNPRMEYAHRDDGKLLLALALGDWRPIYLILDDGRVFDVESLPPKV